MDGLLVGTAFAAELHDFATNDLSGVFEGVRYFFTIITPFVLFWLGLRVTTKKKQSDRDDERLSKIDGKIDTLTTAQQKTREEMRENIEAVSKQMGAFQREVAQGYMPRIETSDNLREIREEVRDLQRNQNARLLRDAKL